jgi:hypothetical protein
MRTLFIGFLTILFVSLHAQDPFAGLPGREKTLPNSVIIDKDDVRIRLTVDGKTNHFTLLKSNMFEFVYDSLRPMGHIVPVKFWGEFGDTAAIYRIAELYVRGKYGAQKNYTAYKAPAVTTLLLTAIPLAGPVLGAAFAVPASLTTPKIELLGHPGVPLVEHRLYYQGYADEARRIKARRVWLNFGVGLGVCLGVMFLNEVSDNNGFLPYGQLFSR